MKKIKTFSKIILVLLLVQFMYAANLSREVKAIEEDNSSVQEFMEVRKETVGFAYQYKDKTIVNNAVIFDNNIKFFVEENGKKHIKSEDFDLIRFLDFIGIYNDNAYVVSEQNEKKSIYKVDLNTYKMEFVKDVPTYVDGKAYITNCTIDSNGVFWFEAIKANIPIYSSTGRIIDYNTKYIIYNDKGFSHEVLRLQDSETTYDTYGQLVKGPDQGLWFSKSFKYGKDNKIYKISKDNNIKEYSIDTNSLIESVTPGVDNTLFVGTREFIKTESGYKQGKFNVRKYKINNDILELESEYSFEDEAIGVTFDSNRNLWTNDNGVISKLENDKLVKKYIVKEHMKGINVYDDKHLVAYGMVGVGYTPISIEDSNEEPRDNSNTDTNGNTDKNSNTNSSNNANTSVSNNNNVSNNTNEVKDNNVDLNNRDNASKGTDSYINSNTNLSNGTNRVQEALDLDKETAAVSDKKEILPTTKTEEKKEDTTAEAVDTNTSKNAIVEENNTVTKKDSTKNFTNVIFITLGVILIISSVGFWIKKNKK
ncbi:hypothetical protein [Clostridium sp. UBA7791]|uniref:hypothetical protein n=1 Tax=Clostridium sp. UBA7791 TaxID=1946379 RepID=UPI003217CE93